MSKLNLWRINPSFVVFLLVLHRSSSASNHRVFPAARVELYNYSDNETPPVLGILWSNNVTFTIVASSNSNQTTADNNDATTSATTSIASSVEEFLNPAITRFQTSLTRFPEFAEDYPVNPENLPLLPITRIEIVVESSNVKLNHGVSESYELNVSTTTIPSDYEGEIVLVSVTASTVFGVLRALETLGQLLQFGWIEENDTNGANPAAANTGMYYIRGIPLYISDGPSYPFRGLMIDTARHFLPLSLILDNLNVMAMNKMNVLHWHISDGSSFPYQSQNHPELAEKGAFHPRRIYTVSDVKRVIEEAYYRGIRVIPEIDMPGHTLAIGKSHPEIMSHAFDPDETVNAPINPTIKETWNLVEDIYEDLANVFIDEFVHVGGDEVDMSNWLKDPSIAQWMKDHDMKNETVKLYDYFETRLLKMVTKQYNKAPIVWQEVFNLNLTIPPNTIIDVWKGFDSDTLKNATDQNYRVILSGCWYLDHLSDTWHTFYQCDPQNFTSPNKDQLLLGGHASMWGEHVDASNFMSRVWPRASAVAERLWRRNVTAVKDTIDIRLHKFRCRMVQQGFAAGPTDVGSTCPTEVSYYQSSSSADDTKCRETGDKKKRRGFRESHQNRFSPTPAVLDVRIESSIVDEK